MTCAMYSTSETMIQLILLYIIFKKDAILCVYRVWTYGIEYSYWFLIEIILICDSRTQ